MLASVSGYEREHWWLAPWWPGVVDEFVRDLDRPKPWLDPGTVRNAPPAVADREHLQLALREWPDRVDRETAAYCVSAGLGHTCTVDPLKAVTRHDYRPIMMVVCPSIARSRRAGGEAMSQPDVPRQRDGEIHVVVPTTPPQLTPRAARALLRLLRNVDARREMDITDQQPAERAEDRRAA